MSPARLPAARREELKAQAYKMSLEDGMSMRAIARQLGIDPHTVSALIREAAAQARESIDLTYARTFRARTRLLEDLEKQLTKEGVSAHAKAQIAHAINSTLDSLDLLAGTRAPSKSAVSARVSSSSSRGATADDYHMDRLSVEELWVFEKLVEKVTASEDGPELYHEDVVEVILEAAREGQLPTDVSDIFDSRSLLENPVVDAETIED